MIERLIEIDSQLRYSPFSVSHYFTGVLALGLLIIFISIYAELKKAKSLKGASWIFGVAISVSLVLMTWSVYETTSLTKERDILIAEFAAKEMTTKEIEIEDIVNLEMLLDLNCQNLQDGQTCYLVEFLSNEDISQTVIGLDDALPTESNGSVKLTYYDYTDKELEFLYQYNEINRHFKYEKELIKDGHWVAGKSIE